MPGKLGLERDKLERGPARGRLVLEHDKLELEQDMRVGVLLWL